MAILGRELVIGADNGAGGFAALCITEGRSLEINNEEVDITKPNCASPGSKLAMQAMYGIQSVRFSGQGAFVDNAAMQTAVADTVNQVIKAYQFTVPTVGTFEGDGLLSLTLSGDKTGELQCDFRLTLTGDVAFVPEA